MPTTTTNYAWTVPTSTDYVAQGATAIQTAVQGADTTLYTALGGNYPGLRLIKSQAVGTGVASVTVTSCFSSTFVNYRVLYIGGVASASGGSLFARGAQGTGTAMVFSGDYVDLAGTRTGLGSTGTTFFTIGLTGASQMTCTFDMSQPFLAAQTGYASNGFAWGVGVGFNTRTGGTDTQTTSSTGLIIAPSSGTITGGTVYVYGYGAS